MTGRRHGFGTEFLSKKFNTDLKEINTLNNLDTFVHYTGNWKNDQKHGNGEYYVIKNNKKNKGFNLHITNSESCKDKIVYGEFETYIKPYGQVFYRGSINEKFEMHGKGSIFTGDTNKSHIYTGYFVNDCICPENKSKADMKTLYSERSNTFFSNSRYKRRDRSNQSKDSTLSPQNRLTRKIFDSIITNRKTSVSTFKEPEIKIRQQYSNMSYSPNGKSSEKRSFFQFSNKKYERLSIKDQLQNKLSIKENVDPDQPQENIKNEITIQKFNPGPKKKQTKPTDKRINKFKTDACLYEHCNIF